MKPRKPLKITSRTSAVTNGFVQAIMPDMPSGSASVAEALTVLGIEASSPTCVYCGAASTDWDHLRPLVRDKRPTGYMSDAVNMVPACGPCNQSKGGQEWRSWMTGKARGSPAARGIADIEARIAGIERFEAWGACRPADLEAIVGAALWDAYWNKLAVIETLMFDAQKDADLIRDRIATALR